MRVDIFHQIFREARKVTNLLGFRDEMKIIEVENREEERYCVLKVSEIARR